MTHDLKTWPEFFNGVENGIKTFEVRRDDRHFKMGEGLLLREWEPKDRDNPDKGGKYTGRTLERKITFVLRGERYGIMDGYAVLGITSA